MCSLERNKNAGNLVVRRNDSTRPSSKWEKNKLLFRGTVSWGSLWERWCTWCEREMTKEAVAWITIKKKTRKDKGEAKESNACKVLPCARQHGRFLYAISFNSCNLLKLFLLPWKAEIKSFFFVLGNMLEDVEPFPRWGFPILTWLTFATPNT